MMESTTGFLNRNHFNCIQRRIGLTGGIASGKSTVSNYLEIVKELPVLDADLIAKDVLAPGQAETFSVIEHFGSKVVRKNCKSELEVDRLALADIIFNDSDERRWLENLVHPLVYQFFLKRLLDFKDSPIIILVVPLLFESEYIDLCSETWVVSCNPSQQIERLVSRDSLSKEQAIIRINSQLSLKKKISLADEVIDNSGHFNNWIAQVDKLI